MFVGTRDEGCQFALDATEVKKTPNCEETPPVSSGKWSLLHLQLLGKESWDKAVPGLWYEADWE